MRKFRNIKEVISKEDIAIESGSLWLLEAGQKDLVLDDDDQYASTKLDEDTFLEV